MTHLRRVLPTLLIVLVGFAVAHSPAVARGAPDSFADLAARLLPAVVNISTTQVLKKAGPKFPASRKARPFRTFSKNFSTVSSAIRRNAARRRSGPGLSFPPQVLWSPIIM